MHDLKSQLISTITIAALTIGVGAVGLARTDLRLYDRTPWAGQYQRAVEDKFTGNLPLRSRAIHVWNAFGYGILGQTGTQVISGKDGWLFTTEEFVLPEAFDFEAELLEVSYHLNQYDIRLIPVIVPDKSRIYSDKLDHDRMIGLETRYAALQALLRRHGLTAIDLRAVLIAGREDGETFMITDTHWSPHGARLTAQEIARKLEMTGRDAFETTTSASEPFEGDLLTFIDTGPFRSITGPPIERIRPSVTANIADASAMFGNVEVPVALVGTSFSARQEFNFPGFLRQELGLDLISYAEEGSGPFSPMRRFLDTLATTKTLPEVVIWEIPERYINMEDMT